MVCHRHPPPLTSCLLSFLSTGCAPATHRSSSSQYGSPTRSWRAWLPSDLGRGSLWWSTGRFFLKKADKLFCSLLLPSQANWLYNAESQTPEERGRHRPLQPAGDQLVGLEEHGRRVPGHIHRQSLSDGRWSQGDLRSASLPTTWGSSRLLR